MRFHGTMIALLLCTIGGCPPLACGDPPFANRSHPFGKREHVVQQLNGEREPAVLPAEIQWVSEPWYRAKNDENAQMPYLTYLAEKDRMLMLVETQQPIRTAFIFSDDHGKTWSQRKWLSIDDKGNPQGVALGLTNLGSGKLMAYPENAAHSRWVSHDYGQSWGPLAATDTVAERYIWDPLLVLKDSTGRVERLIEASWRPTGVPRGSPTGHYSQAYLRSSLDEGRNWSDEVKVPQWLGVNEVNILRASNGDWVAACRLDEPPRYSKDRYADLYSGLGVSISKDKGKTWSIFKVLHEYGRHHPSMVLVPNGEIVMTYVVRAGYPDTAEGFPQYGIEAVVSRDHGQTWDIDHRYILATWIGNIASTEGNHGWCSPQSTSTVLLPDGTILTAFGTGFRNAMGATVWKMDLALVRWHLNPRAGKQG